jgi:hypothetical protein
MSLFIVFLIVLSASILWITANYVAFLHTPKGEKRQMLCILICGKGIEIAYHNRDGKRGHFVMYKIRLQIIPPEEPPQDPVINT